MNFVDQLSPDIDGLRLCWVTPSGELRLYKSVHFTRGRAAVDTILRRAQICGSVEINGPVSDYFADVMDGNGDWEEVVSLDRGSFMYLKDKLRPKRDYCGLPPRRAQEGE